MSPKNLRTLSGKFLRVKFCRPESWDFLGLCGTKGHTWGDSEDSTDGSTGVVLVTVLQVLIELVKRFGTSYGW